MPQNYATQFTPEEMANLLRDLDDLATPQIMGTPIPSSAWMAPERRAEMAGQLVAQGLRFLVADEAAYGEEGLKYLRLPFEKWIQEERHFEDGTGVTVIVVAP